MVRGWEKRASRWRSSCAIVVFLLAAACAAEPASEPGAEGGQAAGAAPAQADPARLVGAWELVGVTGEDGTTVQLALGELAVERDCGTLRGSWRANTYGQFLASIWSGDCGVDIATPEWLSQAASFETDGEDQLLLNARGDVTARLSPAQHPNGSGPPVDSGELRRAFAPGAALPPELVPADAGALVGRWVPLDGAAGRPDTPHIELAADGGWRGSDGCNATGGRWIAGPAGALLAVTGATTLIGCDNVPVGSWLAGASRVGLDGDELVLLDAGGDELGRLRRG